METEDQSLIAFLQATADTRTMLGDFAVRLRKRENIKRVTVYPFAPENGFVIPPGEFQGVPALGSEFGVSAETTDGGVTDWWIQVWWKQPIWYIMYDILRSDPGEDGCHKIAGFPPQTVQTSSELIRTLSDAVRELTSNENEETISQNKSSAKT